MASRLAPIKSYEQIKSASARLDDPHYRSAIRNLPCCATWTKSNIDAHHVRIGLFRGAKKPDDDMCVPLTHLMHVGAPAALHEIGERNFWNNCGVDPIALARDLWSLWMIDKNAFQINATEAMKAHREMAVLRTRLGLKVFKEKI